RTAAVRVRPAPEPAGITRRHIRPRARSTARTTRNGERSPPTTSSASRRVRPPSGASPAGICTSPANGEAQSLTALSGPIARLRAWPRPSLPWSTRSAACQGHRAPPPGAGGVPAGRGGRFAALTPGTRYLWTASVGGDARVSGSFTTAPTSLRRPFSFAVIGDYGSGSEHEWEVGRTLAAEGPSFVLTAGDNSYLVA